MIAVVNKTATEEQLAHLIAWIEGRGFKTDVSRGDQETIVGIIGDTAEIDPFLLESMSIITRVQRVTEPFKLANRAFHPTDTVVDCGHDTLVGAGNFQVIAGPAVVEGPEIFEIARRVAESGATMLTGAAFKARTSPYAFQGLGEVGLDLLLEAGHAHDMPVVCEVFGLTQLELFLDKGVDVLKVGSAGARNLALLRELGRTRTPIILRRSQGGTIDELLMAAEYVMNEGNPNVMLCERGIRTFETRTRSTFDVNAVAVLSQLTHLPVAVDATSAAGQSGYAKAAALAAVAAGADCLELAVHTDPKSARAGGGLALTCDEFDETMRRVRLIRTALEPLEEG